MSHAKQASKRKSRACAVPLLGAAGLSVSLASGAPAATVGPVLGHEITLGEEEISDVSLATFYVFDKENPQARLTTCPTTGAARLRRSRSRPAVAEAVAAVTAGHGHGCGGCGGHGHGCGGCWRGCGGCVGIWWGGCGGCGGCSGGYWCWRNGVRIWCYY